MEDGNGVDVYFKDSEVKNITINSYGGFFSITQDDSETNYLRLITIDRFKFHYITLDPRFKSYLGGGYGYYISLSVTTFTPEIRVNLCEIIQPGENDVFDEAYL